MNHSSRVTVRRGSQAHHWPQVLTETWFRQHYPGAHFTPVVANQPADLEAWLKNWVDEG